MHIRTLQIEQEKAYYFPLLQQLYPQLTEEAFNCLMPNMIAQGYTLVGLFEESDLVAIAGYTIAYNLYDGKHLYLYDFIVDATIRSRGYGQQIVTHLTEIATEAMCENIVLCSKFERVDAIRFYTEKMGFEKLKFVIQKKL